MIHAVTRTPLRVSFVGGGSDTPSFYETDEGAVVSTAVSYFIDVHVRRRHNGAGRRFRIVCDEIDEVDSVDQIQHPIVREALRFLDVREPLEIHSYADLWAGAGLGSSSSFTVGLLNALYALRGVLAGWERLAADAFHLEAEVLGAPIGRQDQSIAALGGFQHFRFHRDGGVQAEAVSCSQACRDFLSQRLLLFALSRRRADTVLGSLRLRDAREHIVLRSIRDLCRSFLDSVSKPEGWGQIGTILDTAWRLKKKLGDNISSPEVDVAYARSTANGASGGKLLGAGRTGVLLLFVEPEFQAAVRRQLGGFVEVPFRFFPEGSTIISLG
jgi:D-glycero-alpha-D-manno-heptose-7-phosphate kinase